MRWCSGVHNDVAERRVWSNACHRKNVWMVVNEPFSMSALLTHISIVDIAVLILFLVSLAGLVTIHMRTKKAIHEINKEIASVQQYQGSLSEELTAKFTSLNNDIDDKLQGITPKFNELVKRVNKTLKEAKRAVMGEVAKEANPLKFSLNETEATLRNVLADHEKELKRMSTELEEFSKELEKMKDDIRERSFDLEL